MADGTQLPFYGVLRLPLRVGDVKTEETFVVSRINEDAILGMPFLVAHNCTMEFDQPAVHIDGRQEAKVHGSAWKTASGQCASHL